MNPLLRLLGVAASNGLLTGQIVFSTAFVGACEVPNWIQVPGVNYVGGSRQLRRRLPPPSPPAMAGGGDSEN